MHKKILSATIGECIHTMSLMKYLSIAEDLGFEINFIGSAQNFETIFREIELTKPDIVVLSYRLTPSVARGLFLELKEYIKRTDNENLTFILGGTNSVLNEARPTGIFKYMFSDVTPECSAVRFLYGDTKDLNNPKTYPADLVTRIEQSYPLPLIRHHFGLPSVEETIEGVRKIAESHAIDIISIGPDQNAQEYFFHPERMNPQSDGSGGVPLRKPYHLLEIYEASRCGNYPLVRCYAGTNELTKWADMLEETIHVAWGAVPLTWYSELDRRSSRPLIQSISENQQAIAYYAMKGVPVEVNESHQWALRNTSDIIEVATAYIASYNAKMLGVKHYIMQYMFNTPPGISFEMDIAKMLAKMELVEALHDDNFTSYRMVRTGLASLSTDPDIAKGQLASSITISMTLRPHIVHVVGFSEGDHLALPEEVIESCKIARGVVDKCLNGLPNIAEIKKIHQRKAEIISETKVLLDAIRSLSDDSADPLLDPKILVNAIAIGLLDAPLLKGGNVARGTIKTEIIDGACRAVDPNSGEILSEKKRIELLSK